MAGYGSDAGFQAWLTGNGYSLPNGAPSPAVLRQRGSDYVDATYGARFAGLPVAFDQDRAWPRVGAFMGSLSIPSDLVPKAVEIASYAAAFQEASTPGSLAAVGAPGAAVKREKVGPLEVEYQDAILDGTASSITPLISSVDGLLAPLLRPATAGLGIWSVGC
ncbi:hypothetical protein GCM10011390_41730 [Aureimonas endophytica]|uniref:Putative DnaT-like domain-containing protein n=1 Tax=Aureimonas endophytica TaxID=2027858 RepID=A0A917EA37_9HYPH|nr:DnaT-like ssDNA-binding protein [Aureimonas endophytica]GGE18212.1 hypothetical protein GCM10011390_41730 [Aureimonas endophytica]